MPIKSSATIAGPPGCRTVLTLAFVLIAALGAVGQPVVPRNDGSRCVGVVSAIGDTFLLTKVGVTVFNNEQSKVPIEAWRIDDMVFGKVTAVLGKHSI
jgi:hypothetical protein